MKSKYPWVRWYRRWSCRRDFRNLSHEERHIDEYLGIDPDSLIRRGLL